jgi:hypothetical protein
MNLSFFSNAKEKKTKTTKKCSFQFLSEVLNKFNYTDIPHEHSRSLHHIFLTRRQIEKMFMRSITYVMF